MPSLTAKQSAGKWRSGWGPRVPAPPRQALVKGDRSRDISRGRRNRLDANIDGPPTKTCSSWKWGHALAVERSSACEIILLAGRSWTVCARALLPGGVPKTRDLPGSALSWPSFLPIREDSVPVPSIDAAYLPAEGRYVVLFVRQRSPVWRAVEGHAANRTARGEG